MWRDVVPERRSCSVVTVQYWAVCWLARWSGTSVARTQSKPPSVRDGGTPVADGPVPGWQDLAPREAALGLRERQRILLSPAGRVDPRLTETMRRSAFSLKSLGTQETYAPVYRLFFSFLWERGLNWDEATEEDVEDWEDRRRRGAAKP